MRQAEDLTFSRKFFPFFGLFLHLLQIVDELRL